MPSSAGVMGTDGSVRVMRRGQRGPVQRAREPSAAPGRDLRRESEGGMQGVGEDVREPHAPCDDTGGGRLRKGLYEG